MKTIILLALLITLSACGGGGGESSQPSPPKEPSPGGTESSQPAPAIMNSTSAGESSQPAPAIVNSTSAGEPSQPSSTIVSSRLNSAGYPDVAGSYYFNTEKISYLCTSGSSGATTPLTMSLSIAQTDNQLSGAGSSEQLNPAVTIISLSQATGTIDKTGNFIMKQTLVAELKDIPGTTTINYEQTGIFSSSGWTGTYTYTAANDLSKISCTYSTTFKGDSIAVKATKTATPILTDSGGIKAFAYEGGLTGLK